MAQAAMSCSVNLMRRPLEHDDDHHAPADFKVIMRLLGLAPLLLFRDGDQRVWIAKDQILAAAVDNAILLPSA